jgi:protein-S-isoprenylcysteine O-methyltransferase Ste14
MEDRPGIVLPPPLILVGAYGLGLGLQRLIGGGRWFLPGHGPIGLGLALVGAGIAFSGVAIFVRRGTAINPLKPATQVVEVGPYRLSRNPMYAGLVIWYLGLAIRYGHLWAIVTLPLAVGVLQSHVIAREEQYLERKFGERYRAYRARVRRWI